LQFTVREHANKRKSLPDELEIIMDMEHVNNVCVINVEHEF